MVGETLAYLSCQDVKVCGEAGGQKNWNSPPSSQGSSAYHSCEVTAHELLCHLNSARAPGKKKGRLEPFLPSYKFLHTCNPFLQPFHLTVLWWLVELVRSLVVVHSPYIDASFALHAPKYNMISLLPGIWSNLHLAEATFWSHTYT